MGISDEFQLDAKCFVNWCHNYGLVQLTIYDIRVQNARTKVSYNYELAPNPKAQWFCDMLKYVDTPLHEGCTKYSQLSAMVKFLNIKSENMSKNCFEQILQREKIGEAFTQSELYVLLYQQKGQWVNTHFDEFWLMFEAAGGSNKGHIYSFSSQSGAITVELMGGNNSSSVPCISSTAAFECCVEKKKK
ncbi:hypothetical protein M9H77_28002 [Catharanthus roseus]|uniref:Uncharacterized protein n=1 Tax=Catharanthus roseus TaxID=4058 RepID=A0ACC0AF14_CATRO|nr:hypothetical protein M9H77_28002 [Catharanthus roseus]